MKKIENADAAQKTILFAVAANVCRVPIVFAQCADVAGVFSLEIHNTDLRGIITAIISGWNTEEVKMLDYVEYYFFSEDKKPRSCREKIPKEAVELEEEIDLWNEKFMNSI